MSKSKEEESSKSKNSSDNQKPIDGVVEQISTKVDKNRQIDFNNEVEKEVKRALNIALESNILK